MKAIRSVYRFQNGMVMVFDAEGNQMPKYQGHERHVLDKVRKDFKGIIVDATWPESPEGWVEKR